MNDSRKWNERLNCILLHNPDFYQISDLEKAQEFIDTPSDGQLALSDVGALLQHCTHFNDPDRQSLREYIIGTITPRKWKFTILDVNIIFNKILKIKENPEEYQEIIKNVIDKLDSDIIDDGLITKILTTSLEKDIGLQKWLQDSLSKKLTNYGIRQLQELFLKAEKQKNNQKKKEEENSNFIAMKIIEEYNFKNPEFQRGVILYYNDEEGIYKEVPDEFIDQAILDCFTKLGYFDTLEDTTLNTKLNLIKKIIKANTLLPYSKFNDYEDIIPVYNGILDISDLNNRKRDDFKIEFDPKYLITKKLPVKYDAKAPSTRENNRLLNYIFEYGGEENYDVILEAYGDALTGTPWKYQTLIVFASPETKTGKSTTIEILERLIGTENVACQSLQALEKEPQSVAELKGKLINICNELPKKPLYSTEKMKSLVSDRYISYNKKYGNRGMMANTIKHFFTTNKLPEMIYGDAPEYRRIIIFRFNKIIPENEQVENYVEKIISEEELSGLLNACLDGLQRLRERGHYDEKYTNQTEAQWKLLSNPLRPFFETFFEFETPDRDDVEYRIEKNILFHVYNAYLNSLGQKECPTVSELTKQINQLREFKIESYRQQRAGKMYYYYLGLKINTHAYEKFGNILKLISIEDTEKEIIKKVNRELNYVELPLEINNLYEITGASKIFDFEKFEHLIQENFIITEGNVTNIKKGIEAFLE